MTDLMWHHFNHCFNHGSFYKTISICSKVLPYNGTVSIEIASNLFMELQESFLHHFNNHNVGIECLLFLVYSSKYSRAWNFFLWFNLGVVCAERFPDILLANINDSAID